MQKVGARLLQSCVLGIRDAVQGKGQEICLCLEFTQVSLATCLDLFLPRCMWVSSKSQVKWESRALAGSSFPSARAKSFMLKSKAFITSSFLPPPHGHSSDSLHCASVDHRGPSRNPGLRGAGGVVGVGVDRARCRRPVSRMFPCVTCVKWSCVTKEGRHKQAPLFSAPPPVLPSFLYPPLARCQRPCSFD